MSNSNKLSYAERYMQSINLGLKNSICKIESQTIEMSVFFESLVKLTKNIQQHRGRLFFFGNGASSSFSNHMALDWSKNGGVLGVSLSDSSMLTALANDYNFEDLYLEFLKINNPNKHDLIITTSSSGNSSNVVRVLQYCKENNINTFALSGLNENNKSDHLANYSLFVPMKTYGMVECIHQIFHHLYLDKFMGVFEWEKRESQNMNSKNFKI